MTIVKSILLCKYCRKSYVYLDDVNISKSSGKSIPMDVKTKQPHCCIQSRVYYDSQNSKIFECNACGNDIRFSEFEKSITGKRIPLNAKIGAHHRCKAKPFNMAYF